MSKIRIELSTEDMIHFTNKPYAKCYYLLDTGIVYARVACLPIVRDIIRNNNLDCKLEFKLKNNLYIEIYMDGYLHESNSLTHAKCCEDILEYVLETDDKSQSAFNVKDMLMVTATNDDELEHYF